MEKKKELNLTSKAETIISTAARFVSGDRAQQHGDLMECHDKIACLWNGYLAARREPAAAFDAADVAHMMVLLKIARSQSGFSLDNWIDMAGYSGIAGQLTIEGQETEEDEAG
jgi:hypothetical protein